MKKLKKFAEKKWGKNKVEAKLWGEEWSIRLVKNKAYDFWLLKISCTPSYAHEVNFEARWEDDELILNSKKDIKIAKQGIEKFAKEFKKTV